MLQKEVNGLIKDVARYKAEAIRARRSSKDNATIQTQELRELRGELHHIRRVTTDRQLELANERQILLGMLLTPWITTFSSGLWGNYFNFISIFFHC